MELLKKHGTLLRLGLILSLAPPFSLSRVFGRRFHFILILIESRFLELMDTLRLEPAISVRLGQMNSLQLATRLNVPSIKLLLMLQARLPRFGP